MESLHIYIAGMWNQKKNTEKLKTVYFMQFRRAWEAYWFICDSLQSFVLFSEDCSRGRKGSQIFPDSDLFLVSLKKVA